MSFRNVLVSIVGFAASLALTGSVCAAAIGPGYSGMWFDPARNGEGLQLQIMSADAALVEWYTYDERGRQRWLQGVGQIMHGAAGDSIEFAGMYVTHGGKFGPQFNPNDVTFQTVGSITLDFSDCNTGTFKYSAYGQSQTLPIQRLTQTMGAGCQSINGVPGEPVQAYAGQSGSWFDPSHSGEGYDLQWMSNGQAIITWFTYDTAGNQVWLLGTGVQRDDAIVFDHLISTSGPKFGTAYDAAAYQEHDWGSLTLTLDCNTGTARYASTQAGFGTGGLNLTHLTALQKPACPYVKPKFSDLYSIAWDEIPVSDGAATDPDTIPADAIADDGTLAGRRNGHLVLWHPDTRTWEDVPRDIAPDYLLYISPDASQVIANDVLVGNLYLSENILLWKRSTGWQILAGNGFSESGVINVSKNFKFIAGIGTNDELQLSTWIQAIDGSQQVLSQGAYPNTTALAVSDDGKVTIGSAYVIVSDWPGAGYVAVRWISGGQPNVLSDPYGNYLGPTGVCNGDCSITYGAGNYHGSGNPIRYTQPWFQKLDGTFAYMGQLPDELRVNDDSVGRYAPNDTNSVGTLAVGIYAIGAQQPPAPYDEFCAPYLWTQATGIISVWALATDLGIGDMDWSTVDLVRLSANGTQMLITGKRKAQPDLRRAVVLHFTPKVSSN